VKRFKKIYIQITAFEKPCEETIHLDLETVDALLHERKQIYDTFTGDEYNEHDEQTPNERNASELSKSGYFPCLRKMYDSFLNARSKNSNEQKPSPLYLHVDSLPQSIRETIFDNSQFNIENWDSLNEAIIWLAWLRTFDVAVHHREAMQMAEYLNIVNVIHKACISEETLLEALYFV
jgi:hypothetical protein